MRTSRASGRDERVARRAFSLLAVLAASSCGARSELAQPMPDARAPATQHGFIEIALGAHHACAVRANGHVACWGSNAEGQLGDGTRLSHSTPTDVDGLNDVVHVTVGSPSASSENAPPGVTDIEAGLVAFSCVIRRSGRVECWGSNALAELGIPLSSPHETPVEVANMTSASSIACSNANCCVIRDDGAVWCWGHGRTAGPSATDRYTSAPVAIPGIEHAAHIALGTDHACAIVAGGRVFCWGSNDDGEFGDGTRFGNVGPREVAGVADAASLTVFSAFTFVRSTAGRWTGWPLTDLGLPEPIAFGTSVAAVAMGSSASIAQREDGSAVTVVGSIEMLAEGGLIEGLHDVVQSAAGVGYVCALERDGSVWCRGDNSSGQLGDGTTTTSATPVRVIE